LGAPHVCSARKRNLQYEQRKISEWLKRLRASKNTKHRRILFMEKPRVRERNSSDSVLQQAISINILFRENVSSLVNPFISYTIVSQFIMYNAATFQHSRSFDKTLFICIFCMQCTMVRFYSTRKSGRSFYNDKYHRIRSTRSHRLLFLFLFYDSFLGRFLFVYFISHFSSNRKIILLRKIWSLVKARLVICNNNIWSIIHSFSIYFKY